MDVYVLDPVTFLPTTLVEGYSSMIWTERFIGPGNFELKSLDVSNTINQIPQGALISLRDSEEVMFAETRLIEDNEDGYPELKITGRTFETFLENRALVASVYNTKWKPMKNYSIGEMMALLAWNHLVNSTGQDPTRPSRTIDVYGVVPNLVVTLSTLIENVPFEWWFTQGPVYKYYTDLLGWGEVGSRNIRPNKFHGTTGTIVSFDTSTTATRGDIIKTTSTDITALRIHMYGGRDRSIEQSVLPPVIFNYDTGDIDDPSYLFSVQDYKNIATVVANTGVTTTPGSGINGAITGLNRKVLFVDQAALDDGLRASGDNQRAQLGRTELQKHKRVRLFDGSISPLSNYKYDIDYYLGDRVTLLARYGFEQTMQVSEYIRTQDHEGDRGYPGLATPL